MCVSSQNFLFDYAYVTKPLYQNIVYFIYYQNLVIIHGNQILFIEDFYMCLDTKKGVLPTLTEVFIQLLCTVTCKHLGNY